MLFLCDETIISMLTLTGLPGCCYQISLFIFRLISPNYPQILKPFLLGLPLTVLEGNMT